MADPHPKSYDIAVIGGGIVGLATAMALAGRGGAYAVFEAEGELAAHQTGHNSGVIHSGLYYRPGTAKARNCAEGREAMLRFCAEHGIAHERCGKIVVALGPDELPMLEELERRGRANGLRGLRRLDGAALRELEPHAAGIAGLHVPETGIVNYGEVARAMARTAAAGGIEIRTGARVHAIRPLRGEGEFLIETAAGEARARHLINCAGLQSDRVARMCGLDPGVRIIPFRGEYYKLAAARRRLVRNLIYPVPDMRFPFLGVHFTRMIDGEVEAGPNAVLALRREGYRWSHCSLRDTGELLLYGGFWRMALRHGRTGLGEIARSLSKDAFVRALRRLMPELGPGDLEPAGSGVRAQAVAPDGTLLDDFRIVEGERMIHVLNAPSPAATSSISIGRTIAGMAGRWFE